MAFDTIFILEKKGNQALSEGIRVYPEGYRTEYLRCIFELKFTDFKTHVFCRWSRVVFLRLG